jgi:hypothetical protein
MYAVLKIDFLLVFVEKHHFVVHNMLDPSKLGNKNTSNWWIRKLILKP